MALNDLLKAITEEVRPAEVDKARAVQREGGFGLLAAVLLNHRNESALGDS